MEFLSSEDLDLQNMTFDEVCAVWEEWFQAAQATNEADKDYYSHSCFGNYVFLDRHLLEDDK